MKWFIDCQDSIVETNHSDEELVMYSTNYNDFLDNDIEIGLEDNFVTLQTCVENDENTLFIVEKEIKRFNF